jgi:rod shape-determining protein MreC
MRNLLLLIRKFGSLILFLFLEILALYLVVRFNNDQREIFLYSSNLLSGVVMENYDAGVDYFKLRNLNDSIANENAKLLEKIFDHINKHPYGSLEDTLTEDYHIIPAKIINKSINLRNNRFTLDKGLLDSVETNMGVLSTDGVVGIIHKVNDRFSGVIPIINTQFQLSAKIKGKNYFGDMVWEPYDERFMQLRHVPKHAGVALGDTVITSGFSSVFPPEIPVGMVDNIKLPAGSNYFDIRVKLFNQLSNLEYVYIVDYKLKPLRTEIANED